MHETEKITAAIERFVDAVGGEDVAANVYLVSDTIGGATSLGERISQGVKNRARRFGECLHRGEQLDTFVCLPVDRPLVAALTALVDTMGGRFAALVLLHREYGVEVALAVPPQASDTTRELAHGLHHRSTARAVQPGAA